MRKLFITISLLIISSPLFSQSNIHKITDTRTKAYESMLQHLPESLREKYQFAIPMIDDLRELERIAIGKSVPLEFFTNMTIIDSGLVVTYTYHNWDTLTQNWDINSYRRELFTYNSKGNQTEWLWQDWDGAEWVNFVKQLYTYDLNGLLTERLSQFWGGAEWVNVFRLLYTYDSNGNLTEFLFQGWDGADWIITDRISYTYDSNGILTEYLWQLWNGAEWVNDTKAFYTYDTNGFLTEWLFQNWIGPNWENSSLYLYTYDLNGNQTEWLWQDWDGAEWVNFVKQLYTYDSDGLLTEYLWQLWDGAEWVNFITKIYTYDSNGILIQYFNQGWDGTEWVNIYIVYVNYTNIVGVEESEVVPTEYSLKQNYPNPFNPVTTLEYTLLSPGEVSLIIYNLLGQEVANLVSEVQQVGYHKVNWNASNLPSGVYFYRLQAGDFVQTRKMVLLK